jgi:L-ascorbate metabolism protein UlaG (beta-lactamase superfamily)
VHVAGFREAVALAAHIGADMLVPIHWDLFASNGERPSAVVDEAAVAPEARLHVLVLRRELPWTVAARGHDA